MKKTTLKFAALTLLGLSNLALADAASELQMRLAKVDVLSAEFVQTVTSGSGKMFNKEVANFKLNAQIYSVWRLKPLKKPRLFLMVKPYGSTIHLCNK